MSRNCYNNCTTNSKPTHKISTVKSLFVIYFFEILESEVAIELLALKIDTSSEFGV